MIKNEVATKNDLEKVKAEVEKVKAEIITKADLEKVKTNLIKWMFFFWISQVLALIGILRVAKVF